MFIGLALVGALYFFFVFAVPWIEQLFNAGKKDKLEERAYELMNQYHRDLNAQAADDRDISQAAPSIQLIRSAEHNGALTCLFVNKGGTAREVSVEPFGAFSAIMTPEGDLRHDETGRVTLQHIASSSVPLEFELSYKNNYGERECRRYQYRESERLFREV